MISLSQFKSQLLAIARLLTANPGMYIDVVYKGRLYRVTMEDLGQEVVQRRRPRKRSLVDKIETAKCPDCKKVMLNGVCMNSRCARSSSRS